MARRLLAVLLAVALFACGDGFRTPVAPQDALQVEETHPAPSGALQSAPKRPLEGPLVNDRGVARDSVGPVAPIGYSDFPALRIYQDDPEEAERTLQRASGAGWQFVRLAYALAEDEVALGGFWRGAHVDPYRTTQKVYLDYLRLASRYRVRLHVFGAHAFRGGWPEEETFLKWLAATTRDAGYCESVILFEWRNEYEITSPYRPRSLHGHEATAIWKAACPLSLATIGAPGEDDGQIAFSVSHPSVDVAAIDLNRGMSGALLMKHAHTVYYHGRYGGMFRGRLLWATEPTGPGVGVYLPLNDPAYLFGLYATYVSTGQVLTYFNGASVRHERPIDSEWGFYELPRLLAFIPEDIGTWTGPSWFTKGNQFLIVLAEEWGRTPPREVGKWELLTVAGMSMSGEGLAALPKGWKAGILKGEWK